MRHSNEERARWFAILLWGLRTQALVVIACVLGLSVALPILNATTPRYQAEALVVARQLQVQPQALPRYGQAVFASDAMARQVADNAGLPNADGLIGDRVGFIPAEDSIILVVFGRDEQRLEAARLADQAAAAFVTQLNRGGSSIGFFDVHSPATVPTQLTLEGPSASASGGVGAVAGTLFGLGMIALLAAVRRPVLQPSDAESAAGEAVIGTVILPATGDGQIPDPHQMLGLVPLTRALLPLVGRRVVLASAPEAAAVRQRLIAVLTLTLARLRNVSVTGSPKLHEAIEAGLSRQNPGDPLQEARPELELVDGPEPLDSLLGTQRSVQVVLVVRYGAPAARVRRLAADYLDDEILGVVLVDERRALRWWRAATERTAPLASVPQALASTRPADLSADDRALNDELRPSR